MQGRHEVKHEISLGDCCELRGRLRQVMRIDPNADNDGRYGIRSLYFDTPEDTALLEKLDGVQNRDKYRIRYYNGDCSFLHLEKKSKRGNLCQKESVRITEQEAAQLAAGDLDWRKFDEKAPLWRLCREMSQRGLQAKTIVDYDREAFVFEPGNVRITLDYHIRTEVNCRDFLNPVFWKM